MDLYHIPNDDGTNYRLYKFVEYQHEVPEIHYRFLARWILKNGYGLDRTVNLSWLLSATYNEITSVILDDFLLNKGMPPDFIWERYKDKLDFGSARKYTKNCDWFVPLMKQWEIVTAGKPYKWLKSLEEKNGNETYYNITKTLRKMRFVGRFSADLFIELIVYMRDFLKINIREPAEIDWINGSNLTSGVFNIFYEDEKALEYEKTGNISDEDLESLPQLLLCIQSEISKTYPRQDPDITMFIGKICSFRNLFKAARYGGFHHDRELGVIKTYERIFPEVSNLMSESYEIRREIFPKKFLGEYGGWDGIRKERKKLWLRKGLTGVEDLS